MELIEINNFGKSSHGISMRTNPLNLLGLIQYGLFQYQHS